MTLSSEPLDVISWPVRTERLAIRPATHADVETTWRFRRRPEVYEWITSGSGDFEEYAARFHHEPILAKTLVVELDGVVIGDLMISVEDAWGQAEVEVQTKNVQAEIGWAFDPSYGGQGYATEAVAGLIRVCFEELGLRRVHATCFSVNVPSWRLMERLGMRREVHTVRESLHRSRGWLDGYGYALLADEWRSRQGTGRQATPGSASPADRDQRHDWWGVVLDSPDASRLARFYADLLGWQVTSEGPDDCAVAPEDGVAYLGCQTSADYVRPVWPPVEGQQQMMLHLDFEVTDLARAVEHAESLGAVLAEHQPQRDVRVMLDPDGHPFCLYTS
jgi:RimJ/RimL family protein N-acetyltransferase/catechol 2,3-dioxygenase-like lactoylglutathione lyase family enzyme